MKVEVHSSSQKTATMQACRRVGVNEHGDGEDLGSFDVKVAIDGHTIQLDFPAGFEGNEFSLDEPQLRTLLGA